MKRKYFVLIIILAILVVDQIIKIVVKTNMYLYETIDVTSWMKIHFIENSGMAWGMTFIPQIVQNIFRIVAIGFLSVYLVRIVRRKLKYGYIACWALVFAGALGNVIDNIFYGRIFSQSTPTSLAVLFPGGGGYGEWFHGKVVDMFYFPLFEFRWPDWMPWVGGDNFVFFNAIFNFADSAISCGAIALLLFYRHYFISKHD